MYSGALLVYGSFYDVFHHPCEAALHRGFGRSFPIFVWEFQASHGLSETALQLWEH